MANTIIHPDDLDAHVRKRMKALVAHRQSDDSEVMVFKHDPGKALVEPGALDVLYSDGRVRVMVLPDIAATPYKGRDVIRIDICEPELAVAE